MQSQATTQPLFLSVKMLPVVAFAFVAMFTTGCNTVAGAGKDIQSAGEKVESTAEKANK